MNDSPLWTPGPQHARGSVFAAWLAWLDRERGLRFTGYRDAWRWSVTELDAFWASIWDFFDVRAARPYTRVLSGRTMPGARWFAGAQVNYAEHAFRHATAARPALIVASELRAPTPLGWAALQRDVASVAASLGELGVGRGDRVVAYLPNVPEAVVAFLACASIGAIWSSCSPDFGVHGAAERFGQVEPKLLIAVDGYVYGSRRHDRTGEAAALRRALPTLAGAVLVGNLEADARVGFLPWVTLLGRDVPLRFEPLPFDHPLWILYSSGSTGPPKAIVHGHGGILLEHQKALALQNDMRPGDVFFWHTTTGWMMWNLLVGGLLAGCVPVLYDGSAAQPDLDVLWRLAAATKVTRFGAGAAYFVTCMKAGIEPGARLDLGALRAIGSTGSPLPGEAYRWIHAAVKADVWLASSSGGTDVATAFLGGCPGLPVHAGELQGATLGVHAQAFDTHGRSVVGEAGELVITAPLPSMPLRFWNDPDDARYRESYFAAFPGVWRHGDLVRFTERGSAVILGRSDATLNRGGVRIGSAEICDVVEMVPGVADSLVVGVERPHGRYWMPLFVALEAGCTLDDALRERIRSSIRHMLSPRHVPDEIVQVPSVPRTLNGKKLEVPVRRLLLGESVERVVDISAVADASSLDAYARYAAELRARDVSSIDVEVDVAGVDVDTDIER